LVVGHGGSLLVRRRRRGTRATTGTGILVDVMGDHEQRRRPVLHLLAGVNTYIAT